MIRQRSGLAFRIFTATALILFGLAGAPRAAELRFTVFTGNDAQLKMLNGIAAAFTQTHPGVTVRFETIPVGDYSQKLTFQIAGGNPPDLGWMLEADAPAFEKAGILTDLGPALHSQADYDFADFSQAAMKLWQKGGRVYGIPFSTSPFMMFFNKTMFDAASLEDPLTLASKGQWTVEAWRQAAIKLSDPAAGRWGFEFKDGQGYDTRMLDALVPMIWAYGGDVWGDKGCSIDSAQSTAAITLLHEMVFKDRAIVPPGRQGDFFSGGSAMTINQISRASKAAEAGFAWGIAPLPTGSAGAAPVIGQAAIVVFSKGKNRKLAEEFIAFMTNKDNVRRMAQFWPPARQSVLNDDIFLNGNKLIPANQMAFVKQAIINGRGLPSHQNNPQIVAAIRPKIDALWKPDTEVRAGLKAVCGAIDAQL